MNLSNFNTSYVTTMYGMFQSYSSLITVDLSNFDTSNVTNMSLMFNNCDKLILIDFINADFLNANSCSYMFSGIQVSAIIYVKDGTQKDWIESKFTMLMGVTAVS